MKKMKTMKMMKTNMQAVFKIIRKVLLIAVTIASVICIVLLGYAGLKKIMGDPLPMVFGWGGAIVVSGSMEPALPVGTLVWIHEQDSYSPGDVVTYKEDTGDLITHRLVAIGRDIAVTRGDANNTDDDPINVEQIRGKVSGTWPGVGKFLLFFKSPAGIIMILLLGGLLLFFDVG